MTLQTYGELTDLGGGRFNMVRWNRPIAYERNGLLRRITNLLGASGDPDLGIGTNELATVLVRQRLGGLLPHVHFGCDGYYVRLRCVGTNNVDGVVNDNTILFPNAWNNCDLRYAVGGHLLQKEIVLRTGHRTSFQFLVTNHVGLDLGTLSTPAFRLLPPKLERDGAVVPLTWKVSTQAGKPLLTVTLPAGDWSGWVLDPTTTIQPAAAAGKDSQIYSDYTDYNGGTVNSLIAGESKTGTTTLRRSLLQFDLSGISPTATINDASVILRLIASGATYASANGTGDMYRVWRAWAEGNKNGAADSPATGVTWIRYDASNNWSTAGCGHTTDDREASTIGTCSFVTTDASGTDKTFTLNAALVQEWTQGVTTNNGLLWKMRDELNDMVVVGSSDHATATNRPSISVTYTEAGGGIVPILMRHYRQRMH